MILRSLRKEIAKCASTCGSANGKWSERGALRMKPHPECGACLVHWVYERAAAHTAPEDTSALIRRIVGILLKETTPTANVGALCNSTVWAALETAPALAKHYEQLKAESNEHARHLLPEAATHIVNADTARAGVRAGLLPRGRSQCVSSQCAFRRVYLLGNALPHDWGEPCSSCCG